MRAIVTGGAGFIGSHLVDRLAANGHAVVAIDNLANGLRSNLDNALATGTVEFQKADVTDAPLMGRLLEGADWVFHLAALADIVPSIAEPGRYHNANVNGTLTILEAARKGGIKRFIYSASSSCYGIPDVYPTPETAPNRPMYPYALTKYVGEQYVLHWGQTYGLPVLSLRLFNVFGPRHRTSGTYGAVFGVFLAQKLAGQPLTVVGDGTQTRDFTFVSDVVEAFVSAAGNEATGEVVNIGSGGTYSVNQLVGLLGGARVNIPKRPGEPECTFADIAKAKRLLDWRPTVDFETGVRHMVDEIDAWRDAPVWTTEAISRATEPWFKYLGRQGS